VRSESGNLTGSRRRQLHRSKNSIQAHKRDQAPPKAGPQWEVQDTGANHCTQGTPKKTPSMGISTPALRQRGTSGPAQREENAGSPSSGAPKRRRGSGGATRQSPKAAQGDQAKITQKKKGAKRREKSERSQRAQTVKAGQMLGPRARGPWGEGHENRPNRAGHSLLHPGTIWKNEGGGQSTGKAGWGIRMALDQAGTREKGTARSSRYGK